MLVTLLTFQPLIDGLPPLLKTGALLNMLDIFVTPDTFHPPILSLKVLERNMLDMSTTSAVFQLFTPLIVVTLDDLNIFVVAVIPTKSGVSVTPVRVRLLQPENIPELELLRPLKVPHCNTSLITVAEVPTEPKENPVTPSIVIV